MRIDTPRWALPLLQPARYKGAHGGRGGGKSHFFAEAIVEAHLLDPNSKTVCIREIQKSLRHSVKALIEAKIEKLGVLSHFDIQRDLILNRYGDGLIIFQGMQDHTADSIKSLEDFDRAWIEEAQTISARSLRLLRPTIRKAGSEIWASWNPENETDPIDQLLRGEGKQPGSIVVEVNLHDNPFASKETWDEYANDRERAKRRQAEGDKNAWADFEHVWHGKYAVLSAAQVLAGCYRIEAFEPQTRWDGPYFGVDWGFASDPTVMVKCWIDGRTLYVEQEAWGEHVETVDTPALFDRIEGARQHVIRADSARPEMISHLRNHGYPGMRAVDKWPGSVEDGIGWLRGMDIVIHPDCKHAQEEARLWSYKTDRQTGDVLPKLEDRNNHVWDACIAHGEKVATLRGNIPVQDVVAGDCVATRSGWKPVLAAAMTHADKPVYRLETAGQTLRATGDHRVFVVGKGFIRLDSIEPGDAVIILENTQCNTLKPSAMAGLIGADTPTQAAAPTASISAARPTGSANAICTGKSGWTTTAPSLTAGTSTTKTAIVKTTALRIWNACRRVNTLASGINLGAGGVMSLSRGWHASVRSPKHGTLRRKDWQSTAKLAHWRTRIFRGWKNLVRTAARLSSPAIWGIRTSIAPTPASLPPGASPAWTTKPAVAPAAGWCSSQTSMPKPAVAAAIVQHVSDDGRAPVYDLMVAEAEEFFASGVLVHNCRYACAPMIRRGGAGVSSVVASARRRMGNRL
nr:MAG TPA: large terminase [Caudoviricetes sp.]